MTDTTPAEYQRIATEEAFAPASMLEQYRRLLASKSVPDPAFNSLWGYYLGSRHERARNVIERLEDLSERRLRDMDDSGISRQIISLTAPGVQVFDAPTGVSIATDANDLLAEAVRTHPTRYSALAAVTPQNAAAGAAELQRCVHRHGFRGAIVNSHTQGEFMDDPKFWPIFEAAEALQVPVYLHPSGPPAAMFAPYADAGLDGAVFGFGAETGLHLLRIIVKGVFDRFPGLRIVVGHCGEGLPIQLSRIDYMHGATVRSNRYEFLKPLRRLPSEYMRENVYVTNSGVAWEPAIKFCQQVLGMDRVLYAMDYPYQFVREEVEACDRLSITAADKQAFFQSNAERVFGLA